MKYTALDSKIFIQNRKRFVAKMQKNSIALDTIDLEACSKRPDPITIPVPDNIPLVVWYNLIDFDETGAVKFYKDVYHQFTY